ncbi:MULTISPECIES: transcription antitermination factor NusB [Tissierellales]|jgi:N utilization substance protein B|uniref:Transcription antitermination protein NusB n=1 Tax=Acidilutibacter cellobiosedens TaxID=2507161 RepID=A0A410QCP9_9FIRM|nr:MULTISPECIES: transcription antitermination factor NusB [Tissierellales]MBE6082596.1 transcription antitermination factor NusB [Tissierellaceae bacterium]QAT61765.1 transcription antitermination factor NusB [Acidilutibacter cellobiosedens]SCL82347.1 hypothetical protein PP176A_0241 [Sporanaerobacter sp. PP17-6a]
MGRKLAREETMKLLYQMDMNNDYSESSVKDFIENGELNKEEKEYISSSAVTILKNLDTIDKNISQNIRGWKISRLAKVDLSILRIAIYELLYREDIPIEVCINEAIEIAKKYSTEESSKFINGMLGNFVRTMENR